MKTTLDIGDQIWEVIMTKPADSWFKFEHGVIIQKEIIIIENSEVEMITSIIYTYEDDSGVARQFVALEDKVPKLVCLSQEEAEKVLAEVNENLQNCFMLDN